MQKSDIIDAVLQELRREFEQRRLIAKNTRAGGNDAESKAEDKYDTRSTEENYLADGLAKQAAAAGEAAAAIEKMPLREFGPEYPADLGALVQVDFGDDDREWFLLVPAGGGMEVEAEGMPVTLLNPESPLGRVLMGSRAGDALSQPRATVVAVR